METLTHMLACVRKCLLLALNLTKQTIKESKEKKNLKNIYKIYA